MALAVASPVIAELLSTSVSPVAFFIPWVFALFVLFYGCGSILIREFSIRWGSGWRGVLLLGAGFGILQEGVSTRAFFDPAWRSLGPLAGHGRWFGVNVIWTLDVILYHAVVSVAIPILLVGLLFPRSAAKPWLSRWGLALVSSLFLFGAAVFVRKGGTYPAPQMGIVACYAAVVVTVILAWWIGRRPAAVAPATGVSVRGYFLLGFGTTVAVLMQMYLVPQLFHWPAGTLGLLAAVALGSGRWLRKWSGNGYHWTPRKQFALIAGVLLCFAMMASWQDFNPTRSDRPWGSVFVAAGAIGFLWWMDKRLRAAETLAGAEPADISGQETIPAGAYLPLEALDHLGRRRVGLASPVSLAQRAVEMTVAAFALLVTSPIMLLFAILIRLGTPGPALFFQDRLGLDRKPFRFVKFRTLYADARQRFPHLYAYQYDSEELKDLKFKVVNDPRVTPQGAWMRRSTMDEVPNFWNVLTGDMALVGPRPEIPEMLVYYKGEMLQKFTVRPGITGLAQISGRGRLGFYETVNLDVEYVKRRSLLLDLKIVLLTVYKMITQEGAF